QGAKVAQGILTTPRRGSKIIGAASTDRAPLRPPEGLARVDETPEGAAVPMRELVDHPCRYRRTPERLHLVGAIAMLCGERRGHTVARRDELTERERVELVHRVRHRTTLALPRTWRGTSRRSGPRSGRRRPRRRRREPPAGAHGRAGRFARCHDERRQS